MVDRDHERMNITGMGHHLYGESALREARNFHTGTYGVLCCLRGFCRSRATQTSLKHYRKMQYQKFPVQLLSYKTNLLMSLRVFSQAQVPFLLQTSCHEIIRCQNPILHQVSHGHLANSELVTKDRFQYSCLQMHRNFSIAKIKLLGLYLKITMNFRPVLSPEEALCSTCHRWQYPGRISRDSCELDQAKRIPTTPFLRDAVISAGELLPMIYYSKSRQMQ